MSCDLLIYGIIENLVLIIMYCIEPNAHAKLVCLLVLKVCAPKLIYCVLLYCAVLVRFYVLITVIINYDNYNTRFLMLNRFN